MASARDRLCVDRVAAPVNARRGGAACGRQVERAGIIGYHHPAARKQAGETTQREAIENILGCAAHICPDRFDQLAFGRGSRYHHVGAGCRQGIAHFGEFFWWSAPPGIARAWMQGGQGFLRLWDGRQ